jgi:hypothetical protein
MFFKTKPPTILIKFNHFFRACRQKPHQHSAQGGFCRRAFGSIFYLPQTNNAAQGQVKGCRLYPSCGCTEDSLFRINRFMGFMGFMGDFTLSGFKTLTGLQKLRRFFTLQLLKPAVD